MIIFHFVSYPLHYLVFTNAIQSQLTENKIRRRSTSCTLEIGRVECMSGHARSWNIKTLARTASRATCAWAGPGYWTGPEVNFGEFSGLY